MNQETENQELNVEIQKPFISRLTVSKVTNLGNYENRKVEISVNFAKAEKVGDVVIEIEQIIEDLNCLKSFSQSELSRARKGLEKPSAELDEYDIKRIPEWKETIAKFEALEKRRQLAIEKLNDFGGEYQFNDAKDSWDDNDDSPW